MNMTLIQGHQSAAAKTAAPTITVLKTWKLVYNTFEVFGMMNLVAIFMLMLKGENLTCMILSKKLEHWLVFGQILTDFFQTWPDDRDL